LDTKLFNLKIGIKILDLLASYRGGGKIGLFSRVELRLTINQYNNVEKNQTNSF